MLQQKPKTEYEEIRALWYKRLADEGFIDIEQDEDNLKSWSLKFHRSRPRELGESREAYYYMAGNFLNDYKFSNQLEYIIWEYHTNAISVRNIAIILKDSGVKRCSRGKVWYTVKRLQESMKKMYMSHRE